MTRDRVIEALTPAVAAADAGLAYEALAQVEWLRRGSARRLLAHTLTDAAHRAGEAGLGNDAATVQHVLRVASLELRGGVPVDFHDREATREAYDLSSPPAPRPRFPVVTAVTGAVALALAALVGWQATRPPPPPPRVVKRPAAPAGPSRDFSRPVPRRLLPAPTTDAYEKGGVPLANPLIEKAFAETFPHLVVATAAVVQGAREYAEPRKQYDAQLRDPALLAAFGPPAAARWKDLLDQLAETSRVRPQGERLVNAAMRLHDAAGLLDDELARAGLGYFLDSDLWDVRQVGLAVFYLYKVQEVRFVGGAARPTRVLVVRRLDKLNVSISALGMAAEYLRDPLVLEEPMEAHAVTRILPAIDADRPLELGDDPWNASDDGRAVARLAGQVTRAELNGPLGDQQVLRARVVGVLLADREQTVREWRAQAAGKIRFARIDTPLVDAEIFNALRGVVDDASLSYGGKLDVRLSELDVEGVVALVVDLLLPSVARHEAQHARDNQRDTPLALPPAIADVIGLEREAGKPFNPQARSVKNELSGYLAQIASNPEMARLDLILLSHWAFDREEWGRPESYVAAFAIAEIARQLGAPLDGPPVVDRDIDRKRLAKAMLATLAHPTADVRVAAGRAWAALFGEPLVPLE